MPFSLAFCPGPSLVRGTGPNSHLPSGTTRARHYPIHSVYQFHSKQKVRKLQSIRVGLCGTVEVRISPAPEILEVQYAGAIPMLEVRCSADFVRIAFCRRRHAKYNNQSVKKKLGRYAGRERFPTLWTTGTWFQNPAVEAQFYIRLG